MNNKIGLPPKSPPIIAVVGGSNTGKTTLLVGLIAELTRREYRVGAVKHSQAGFALDARGKDSDRLKRAGATGILLVSRNSVALIEEREEELTPREAAARFFPDADIVLVEGWKQSEIPKITMLGDKKTARLDNTIAEVGRKGASSDIPLFAPSQVRELADFILAFSRLSCLRKGSRTQNA